MRPQCSSLLLLFGLTSCLAEPPAEPASELVLRACDARGQPASLSSLPRQPRLELEIEGLTDPAGAPWLFSGSLDAGLLRDLQRLPLTAASQERLVPTRRTRSGRELWLAPTSPLRAASTYSLALPPSALTGAQAQRSMQLPWSAELRVAESPEAGAAVRGSFPGPGASGVPPGLAWALFSFDGEVAGFEDGVWLQDAQGLAVAGRAERQACERVDTDAVSCIRWTPDRALAPASRYSLRTGQALRDDHGAQLSEQRVELTTGADDTAAAAWQPLECARDEQPFAAGCVLLQDDRVVLRLAPAPSTRVVVELDGRTQAALPQSQGVHIALPELAADTDYALTLQAFDTAAQVQRMVVALHTTPPLPTLSISEVYADPAGKEPDQEFVELWNFGEQPIPIAGLYLSDSSTALGTRIDSELSLAPGARALLVSGAFNPESALDPAPRPGTLLLRIGKTLSQAGLSNHGEPLFLRDAAQHRLSAAPERPTPRPGQCLVRVSADPRSGDPGSFEHAADGGCTPGY